MLRTHDLELDSGDEARGEVGQVGLGVREVKLGNEIASCWPLEG